ncbi:MFS transporter [Tardiphaga sp. vice352]|uniref:MFS transporter n=1 Tax=unclassified Tardiphaga TaxID=2631404 RepID=UPI0011646CFA|nr:MULTISPECIES: MFS transporter [unclassified Tardiphaga]MBC7585316.1 MFS transporter [Tardiphaga sp.]QDM17123.1 MFS transporter [Tardiphaga sp. vice278]QDM22102.1 MFS transporter [Tardiphaga sp. vice154]QDM27357.1 MFS transporter [Tardiphaga sp. vice304]QDM32483.1 MFS transporter [Tardiphaga sp. vice352]
MDPKASQRTALAVLGVCFTLSVLGRGLQESFTVFLLPISQAFDWDRGDVVSIYSLTALCIGLASPLVGRLFDRSGPRAVFVTGLALIGGAFLAASFAQQLWQFQVTIGIALGCGVACISNVPNSILLGRWFGKRLPTAMSVVYSATGAGVLIMLPFAQILIDRLDWRGAYQTFGWMVLALLLPLVLLPWRFFANGSEHLEKPEGHDLADEGWTLPRAMRHHAFWALFSTFFFTAIGMYAIAPQVVAYLIDAGFPPLTSATAWGFSGVVLLFGMLGVSWLDGVIGRRPSILFSYTLSIAGIVMLWLLQWYPNYFLLTGFVICFGSMIGSRGPLLTATAMKIFRGPRVGTIYGTITIGSGLGSALGSWSGGLLHDWTQSYNPLIAFALVSVVIGMIPFLVVPALRR